MSGKAPGEWISMGIFHPSALTVFLSLPLILIPNSCKGLDNTPVFINNACI